MPAGTAVVIITSCLPAGATDGSKLEGTTMNEFSSSGISPRMSLSLYSLTGTDEKPESILISGLMTVSSAKRAMIDTNDISRPST